MLFLSSLVILQRWRIYTHTELDAYISASPSKVPPKSRISSFVLFLPFFNQSSVLERFPTMPRVFLVAGATTGLGNRLVQEVLDNGHIANYNGSNARDTQIKGAAEKVSIKAAQIILWLKNP